MFWHNHLKQLNPLAWDAYMENIKNVMFTLQTILGEDN